MKSLSRLVSLRACLALSVAMLLAFSSPVAASVGESEEDSLVGAVRVLSSTVSDTGAVTAIFSNGVTVTASPGTQISFATSGADDGRSGSTEVWVDPPEVPADQLSTAAAAYAAAGRSPARDARDAGLSTDDIQRMGLPGAELASPNGRVWDAPIVEPQIVTPSSVYGSGCLTIDSSVYWTGCYTRYATVDSDPNNSYVADKSQGTGHGKGVWFLKTGRVDHQYASTTTVVQWSPGSDVPGNNCTTQTFSLSAYGVTLSSSVQVCPTKISIAKSTSRFYAQWNGKVMGTNPGVAAQDFAKVPNGKTSGFTFHIYEYHAIV